MRALPPQPSSARHARPTIRRVADRLRAAWRVLRHGPELAGRRDAVEVPLEHVRDAVECILAGVGLPYTWAGTATSSELASLANAIDIARQAREREWESFVDGCSRPGVRL